MNSLRRCIGATDLHLHLSNCPRPAELGGEAWRSTPIRQASQPPHLGILEAQYELFILDGFYPSAIVITVSSQRIRKLFGADCYGRASDHRFKISLLQIWPATPQRRHGTLTLTSR